MSFPGARHLTAAERLEVAELEKKIDRLSEGAARAAEHGRDKLAEELDEKTRSALDELEEILGRIEARKEGN